MNDLTDLKHPNEIQPFFEANRDKLADPEWLAQALAPQCRWIRKVGGGILLSQQNPKELAEWLILAAIFNPRSYLEIGVYECGTFYITDSYLRVACSDYRCGTAVDKDARPSTFDEYAKSHAVKFVESRFCFTDLKESFDLAFIDSGHGTKRVLGDFDKIKDTSRLVGFHDISWKRTRDRVGAAFKEITASFPQCPKWEITGDDKIGINFGIGAILLKP